MTEPETETEPETAPETETAPPAGPEGEDDVPDPAPPEAQALPEEPPATVEPTLSLEEFAMLEGLSPHVLAALTKWNILSGRGNYATATQWQESMRMMHAYTPH
jgi:hypothetical protein